MNYVMTKWQLNPLNIDFKNDKMAEKFKIYTLAYSLKYDCQQTKILIIKIGGHKYVTNVKKTVLFTKFCR
jgi:hypothetical protein